MSENILEVLAESARQRSKEEQKRYSLSSARADALALPRGDRSFERALREPDVSFICECKKASPSKGVIDGEYRYIDIAESYEEAGASAISVLTEPTRFLGSDAHLAEISARVSIPCLRKDFTIDDYMIYRAKLLGASAVLLIRSILSEQEIRDGIELCDSLGISALVEVHDAEEMESALRAGARAVGVNNRCLRDFSVDITNSARLRSLAPDDVIFVAESGITSSQDVDMLRRLRVDAALVGEAMMRAPDKRAKLDELRGRSHS